MIRFFLGLTIIGVVAGIGGMVVFAVSGADGSCPYGNLDKPSSSASVSCKPRPAPSAEQRAAVTDGSALKNGLAAFKSSKEAKTKVLGVGLNAWGETTFTMSDGKNLFGGPKERHVTFDRDGDSAPQSGAFTRKYAVVTSSDDAFAVGQVKSAGVRRAMARVRRGAPDLAFSNAKFSRNPFGQDRVWMFDYRRGTTGGTMLQMQRDGSGLCGLTATGIRGVKACTFSAGATGITSAPSTPSTPSAPNFPPATPSTPGAPSIDCVKKAGTDAVKLQKCLN